MLVAALILFFFFLVFVFSQIIFPISLLNNVKTNYMFFIHPHYINYYLALYIAW